MQVKVALETALALLSQKETALKAKITSESASLARTDKKIRQARDKLLRDAIAHLQRCLKAKDDPFVKKQVLVGHNGSLIGSDRRLSLDVPIKKLPKVLDNDLRRWSTQENIKTYRRELKAIAPFKQQLRVLAHDSDDGSIILDEETHKCLSQLNQFLIYRR